MRNTMVAAFGALALTLATPAAAQHHGGFHGGHMGGFAHFRGGGFHGHGFRSSVVFFAPPLFWGPAYYAYGYPYYAPYPVTYVDPAPVLWYCPDQGYYPAVPTCAREWLRVVPPSGAAPY